MMSAPAENGDHRMFTVQSAGLTDVGRNRNNNEDAYEISPPCYMVADGMGGAAAGEIASRMAIDVISADLSGITHTSDKNVEKAALKAYRHADDQIKQEMKKNPQYAGMGTTFVMAIQFDDRLFIANIGDSRAYIVTSSNPGKPGAVSSSVSADANAATGIMEAFDESSSGNGKRMTRLTVDHSVVMEMVEAGIIEEDDIRTHPMRNRITRCLGSTGNTEPEFCWYTLKDSDTLLLCSDGLWEMIHEELMLAIFKSTPDLDELNRRLVKAANNSGGVDNITLVTARFSG
ncbi:PP2C family protein-serine/threonine phosphatase [Candidatus Latescibacterota bacterium]